ncbi:MAG: class I SAM-dependent methyltransferase [Pseudomonadota bacterium]|nr:class I SAM-dependent methyltransferase [Pseudomonadota bacterium]
MSPLRWNEGESVLVSFDGARRYPVVDGIPCLFAPNEWPQGKSDVTDMVKSFYEETPFPNYDDLDGRESLQTKAKRGVFARLLDEQLPRSPKVLEAGCGTGQLSNFVGMGWGRTVIGADLCLNSLRLVKSFRDRCSIENVQFVQMNLFRPPFADGTFDLVISNGVPHHTSDPEGGIPLDRAQAQAGRLRDRRPVQLARTAANAVAARGDRNLRRELGRPRSPPARQPPDLRPLGRVVYGPVRAPA